MTKPKSNALFFWAMLPWLLWASAHANGQTPAAAPAPPSPDGAAAPMAVPASLPPVAQPRGGLPHVFAKLRAGQPVAIVYFGGSITSGSGSSRTEQNSYRALVGQWFTTTFPHAAVSNLSAAIGGTGSDLGAFRTSRDVLSKKPDLVFVEYAVNDGPNALSARGMEGIVRQIRRANPATDICFVYTYNLAAVKEYETGQVLKTAAQDEIIAAYYSIASVNVGEAEAEKIMTGGLVPVSFFSDRTHPNDAGHQAYADAIIAFLKEQAQNAPAPAATPPALPAPLRPDSLEQVQMADMDAGLPLGAGWTLTTTDPTRHFPRLLTASRPGSQQTIAFSGSVLGMYWVSGPDAGEFDYQIDGGPTKTIVTSDKYSTQRYRDAYHILEGSLPDTPHKLTLTIRAEHDAYSVGTTVRIGQLLLTR